MQQNELKELLKQQQLKMTRPRLAVLALLEKNEQPVSAEEIFLALQKEAVSVNLSTVYRILETLSEKKLIKKFSIAGESKLLYSFAREEHGHYLICLKCRKFLPLEHCPLEDYEKALAQQTNYTIAGHSLDIYGYCPECNRKINSRQKTAALENALPFFIVFISKPKVFHYLAEIIDTYYFHLRQGGQLCESRNHRSVCPPRINLQSVWKDPNHCNFGTIPEICPWMKVLRLRKIQ